VTRKTCVECGRGGATRECEGFTGDGRRLSCGGWTHGRKCYRQHFSICFLSPEAKEKVLAIRKRADRQRRNWHGSAGERGPGL
jgi:hypothetical protein